MVRKICARLGQSTPLDVETPVCKDKLENNVTLEENGGQQDSAIGALGESNGTIQQTPPSDLPAQVADPVIIDCDLCDEEVSILDMKDHLLTKHLNKKLSVPLCRIESCQKCIYANDGLVIHHPPDSEEDEPPSIGELNDRFDNDLVSYYTKLSGT